MVGYYSLLDIDANAVNSNSTPNTLSGLPGQVSRVIKEFVLSASMSLMGVRTPDPQEAYIAAVNRLISSRTKPRLDS